MKEEHRVIEDYESLYEITVSGKIFSNSRAKYLTRKEDEYGFHIVKLYKAGTPSNHKVFQLWKKAFPELSETKFKGAKTVKYK